MHSPPTPSARFDAKRRASTLAHTPPQKRRCLDSKPELYLPVDLFADAHPSSSPPRSPSDHPDYTTPHISPADPALAPAPFSPPVDADKFTKSRAVGQVHRDNEKGHVDTLRSDVDECRANNNLLFGMFALNHRIGRRPLSVPLRRASHVNLVGPYDRPEDADVVSDDDARARGMYRLSPCTAAKVGQRYMSPGVAAVLMEVLVYRRNVVVHSGDPNRRKRRRGSFRFSTTSTQAAAIFDFAVNLFAREASRRGVADNLCTAYVDRMLGAVSCALEAWSCDEKVSNPPPFESDDEDTDCFPPGSPTSPRGAEFGSSPNRRRGEGAKRCSRCSMVKVSGSGHGRSKCDDGHSISSRVPYPASPRSDGNQSS